MSQKSGEAAEEHEETRRVSRESDDISDISEDSYEERGAAEEKPKPYRTKVCKRGPGCYFLSIGACTYIHPSEEVISDKPKGKTPCRNGPKCCFLSKGNCSYFHPKNEISAMHSFRNSTFRQASRKTK
jgi:hypothetical protein